MYRDRDLSHDSDQLSEPELGVSLARIGLPESYPEQTRDCDHTAVLSDGDSYRECQQKYDTGYLIFIILGTYGTRCNSNKCFLSGSRDLENLLSTLLHQVRKSN